MLLRVINARFSFAAGVCALALIALGYAGTAGTEVAAATARPVAEVWQSGVEETGSCDPAPAPAPLLTDTHA